MASQVGTKTILYLGISLTIKVQDFYEDNFIEVLLLVCFVLVVMETEPRTSCALGKCSTTVTPSVPTVLCL